MRQMTKTTIYTSANAGKVSIKLMVLDCALILMSVLAELITVVSTENVKTQRERTSVAVQSVMKAMDGHVSMLTSAL